MKTEFWLLETLKPLKMHFELLGTSNLLAYFNILKSNLTLKHLSTFGQNDQYFYALVTVYWMYLEISIYCYVEVLTPYIHVYLLSSWNKLSGWVVRSEEKGKGNKQVNK